ncbi:hypothetical protein ROZALSC1DRAFT_32074 [Rozella allomycis CSF55]|uniref:Uncharacterized protein n=1 Tax=Rozella allomycis (strain CSF55) TaxID=988480 RepID=A0A4V1IYS2_ROZAC|nr:hypothetical protein ROZALSC1DRAFT_32074 [Rozella allomycis CSF55]
MDQNEDVLSIIDRCLNRLRKRINGVHFSQEDRNNDEYETKLTKRLECLDKFLNWIKEIENRQNPGE